MIPKIKNIIIFTVIAVALILVYIFFIKPEPEEQGLVTYSPTSTVSPNTGALNGNSLITQDLLSLLLSVKSIKLEDSIFSDAAFLSLKDSTILLIPSGNEGRTNPFAPIGFDVAPAPSVPVTPVAPTCTPPLVLNTSTNTCSSPAPQP